VLGVLVCSVYLVGLARAPSSFADYWTPISQVNLCQNVLGLTVQPLLPCYEWMQDGGTT